MRRNKIFENQIFAKPAKRKCDTNETDVFYIDDFWSIVLLDLNDHGWKNSKGLRYISVAIDNLWKLEWTIPIKNENKQ